jgi:hypothetical protein
VIDEKMLEKLVTHDVKDISKLFSLTDKCVRAAKGRAWLSQPTPEAGKGGMPEADAAAQSSGKNKNRKKRSNNNNNKPLTGAPIAVAITAAAGGGHGPHGDMLLHQPSDSNEGRPRCLVHNSRRHSIEECRKIKKLAE